ncbi:MAG: hypothetical protein QOK03_2753, partial [Candidatus Binataceae bacterium]|nr:hypothetical protein [Candidatus Binataceae bacterium]
AIAKITRLRELVDQNQRDASEIEIIVCPYTKKLTADDVKKYAAAGVDELVILSNPPEDESRVVGWVERLATQWLPAR